MPDFSNYTLKISFKSSGQFSRRFLSPDGMPIIVPHWDEQQTNQRSETFQASRSMAKQAGARPLNLTHFRKHMDEPVRYELSLKQASQVFGAPMIIAEDLQQIET